MCRLKAAVMRAGLKSSLRDYKVSAFAGSEFIRIVHEQLAGGAGLRARQARNLQVGRASVPVKRATCRWGGPPCPSSAYELYGRIEATPT